MERGKLLFFLSLACTTYLVQADAVKLCSDLMDVSSFITWDEFCAGKPHSQCTNSDDWGPKCVCKDGFKDDGTGDCLAITCADIRSADKSWDDHCNQVTNMYCKEDTEEGPQCVCEIGFKEKAGHCIATTCADIRSADKSWDDHCNQLTNMYCKEDTKEGPQCVCKIGFKEKAGHCIVERCSDIMDQVSFISWNEFCASKRHSQCTDSDGWGPKCECNNGFKDDGNGNGGCLAQTCANIRSVGNKSWNQHCNEKPNKDCMEDTEKGPQCVCKAGFKEDAGHCIETLRCPDMTNVDGVKWYGDACKQGTVDLDCLLSCVPGFILMEGETKSLSNIVEITCLPKGEWNKQVTCKAVSVQKCSDVKDAANFKTWAAHCADFPNQICLESAVRGPQCVCKDGFKDNGAGKCLAELTCNDRSKEDPSKTWLEFCGDKHRQCVEYGDSVFCGVCLNGFRENPQDNDSCIGFFPGCRDLVSPTGGLMAGECQKAKSGAICLFACETGRKLVGEGILTCLEKGTWNFKPPICTGSGVPGCESLKDGTGETWSEVCDRENRPCVFDPREGPKCGCQQGLTEICLCTKKRQLLQGFLSYIIQGRNNRYLEQIDGPN